MPSNDREPDDSTAARGPLPVRRLLALARPEWRTLSLGFVFLLLASASGLAYPQAIRLVIDTALERRDLRAVDQVALAMAAVFFVQSIAFGLRYYLFSVAGERIVTRLRERVYGSIVSQEIAFFDERRTGELTSRLSSDKAAVRTAATDDLTLLVRDGALALGGIGLLFYHQTALTLVMLSLVVPTVLLAFVLSRRIERLSRGVHDALAEAGSVAQETISGIRTVRAFVQEGSALARYGRAVWTAFDLSRHRTRRAAILAAAMFLAGYTAISAVVWFGGRLVVSGELSVGTLAMFMIYAMIVAFSLAAVGERWVALMGARGAAKRIFDLVDRAPRIPAEGGVVPKRVLGRVAFEGVRFAYPSRPEAIVLHGIDLAIEPGEIVALVGPSGSGKSTIASLIPRFYDPDQGRVSLDGRDLRELDPLWLRRQIGVVAQEPILFSDSVAGNVRYGKPGATDDEVVAALQAANADAFVREFPQAFATEVGERGVQLSAGQKQRIAIARAVLKDPRILILDEATSALDAESEHLVKEALDRLMVGRTTLVIAHRLSTVRHAHRVLVIEGGRVVQAGGHDDLMRDEEGLYRRLVRRQFLAT